jgi:rhamnulokinase
MSIGKFLAFDIGTDSGRAMSGVLEDKRLFMEEIHRFSTGTVSLNKHSYWNIYRFYEEIIKAISICINQENFIPESIAFDSFGSDFGFLDEDGCMIRLPYAGRNSFDLSDTKNHLDIPAIKIYEKTGVASDDFSSIHQLFAMKAVDDPALKSGKRLMFIPDLLNYLMSGENKTEISVAGTSQLFNPLKRDWDDELLSIIGINRSNMNEIINPGENIGVLKPSISQQTDTDPIRIVSVCSLDSASAVIAVPAVDNDWAFFNSGLMSSIGIEIPAPNISSGTFDSTFSNSGGFGNYRFHKKIMGLRILQQCRKAWSSSSAFISYTDLIEMAEIARPFKSFIDPDFKGFYNTSDMPASIDEFCALTNQESPTSIGEYVRSILEGMALKNKYVLDQLKQISGRTISRLHIIGGGAQNKLLCQFTANACGLKVIAGPQAGSAAGNLLVQAYSLGYLNSLDEIRRVVNNSFNFTTYLPEDFTVWENAYSRFFEMSRKAANINN